MSVWETPVGATVEWYTPPDLFDRLGFDGQVHAFDLDPCAPPLPAADWIPARHRYSHDGEKQRWFGQVWLNPPYGPSTPAFIDRMIEHKNGIALVAARTETKWFQAALATADMGLFLADRLHFIRADGFRGRSSHGSVLLGWGSEAVDCLLSTDRRDLGTLAFAA